MMTLPGYELGLSLYEGTRTLVYRAIRTADNRPVIIKFLRNEYPTFSELVQFRNQYTIAKNLNLPGIVQPLALETYGNGYALVMPDEGYIALNQWQSGTWAIADFLVVAIQLADILHGLLQNRTIHKDIKPANILIHPGTKQIKLIDFSISSLLPKETLQIQNPNVLEGTLAYISPEQTGRMNRGIDYRTDFYSLGITFYELLTGKLPFQSDEPMELVHCHIAKMPLPLAAIRGEASPAVLSEIVMKLMAKNAEDRYQSALGLKHDLETCLYQLKDTGKIDSFEIGQRDICDRFVIPEKLYGRESEVRSLLDAFDRAAAGNTEMILVAGFSGIGKTAVVNEVHKPIVRQRGYFIKGKFDQFNRNIPFSAFVQAFRDLMGQLLAESDDRLQQWKDQILSALGENGQVIVEVIPELERIVGQQPPVPELSGSAAQNRFNLLFGKFIQVFTTREHPVAIFLDDLQWADSASLNLLKLLTDDRDRGYLLVLGAYRDNEVFPTHPLMLTLDEIEKTGAILNTITLNSLSQKDLNFLVGDTLACSPKIALPLTKLVAQKTQGNPFFAAQFLKGLHEDRAIVFNVEAGHWQCDMTRVQELALTDDVVEFMASRLHKLPQATQEVLKLAACIGNQFDLATLAIVSQQPLVEVATDLWRALQEGLVLPISDTYKFFQSTNPQEYEPSEEVSVGYKFLHDRVQQAAYSLISAARKQATHLDIGTLLLENLSESEREERIFEIVNHLNIGRRLMTQSARREELARLNLIAGCKAKASTAYAGALSYITAGMELLPDDCWHIHYALTLNFYKERAEVEYLNGNFEKAEAWIDRTLKNAKTPMEKAEIYNMSIVQNTLQAKYPEAIQAGRRALTLIDIELPEENFDEVRDAELAIAKETLTNRSFASLAQLPLMAQTEKQMAIKLLISMGPPTYRSHQRLWSVICAKAVNLCLQYGNTPEIGYIYPAFGGLRGYALNNYQGTKELLEVTLQLTQAFHNKSAQSVAYLMIGSSLRHWSHPLKVATEDYLSSYKVGLESSNLQYAAYAFGHNMYCRFYQSLHLEKLLKEINESLAFSHKYKNQWAIDLMVGGRAIVLELLGNREDSTQTVDPFSEFDYLEQCHRHKNWQVICIYNILKTQLLFLLDRPTEALEYGRKADAEIINVAPQGLLPYARHIFIYLLLLISQNLPSDNPRNIEEVRKIKTYKKQLELWAQNCPENFQPLNDLVKAEIARTSGNFLDAIDLYESAISGAKESESLQDEAIASELAAKFYLQWGKEKIAQIYAIEAYYCYARWGAKAKTDRLETIYSQLLAPVLQQPKAPFQFNPATTLATTQTVHSSSTNTSFTLDLASAIKASQALSGEIELEALISKLMKLVLENAGADKGALIMNNAGTWAVVAQYIGETCNLSCTPLEMADTILPTSLIRAVQRTHETRILNCVKKDTRFAGDPYLIQQSPQSLFCTPIINQGRIIGMIYLENNLSAEAFTPDRVEVLNLLCSQAAISLENARLYANAQVANKMLQKSLQDLQQAQLQLVQSEKMSALGNLVAGVAHEINNPVGFIAGNLQPAQDYVQDLLGLLDLYQEKMTEKDEEIKEEIEAIDLDFLREDLPKLIGSMKEGTDRIHHISTSLRTFSRTDKDYKVPFNLHEGLDSTILILKHRLKASETRPAIDIVQDYGKIPEIQCFPGQLNQVFMNLIANAIDALEESNKERSFAEIQANPNRIILQTQIQDEFVIIRIIDNGKGMSEEVKSRIFEQGFTTKDVGKGTGLGLAIARQIVVEKHNGKLQVNSQMGQGTEFVISLPQR